jgi:hypothetical protein
MKRRSFVAIAAPIWDLSDGAGLAADVTAGGRWLLVKFAQWTAAQAGSALDFSALAVGAAAGRHGWVRAVAAEGIGFE